MPYPKCIWSRSHIITIFSGLHSSFFPVAKEREEESTFVTCIVVPVTRKTPPHRTPQRAGSLQWTGSSQRNCLQWGRDSVGKEIRPAFFFFIYGKSSHVSCTGVALERELRREEACSNNFQLTVAQVSSCIFRIIHPVYSSHFWIFVAPSSVWDCRTYIYVYGNCEGSTWTGPSD